MHSKAFRQSTQLLLPTIGVCLIAAFLVSPAAAAEALKPVWEKAKHDSAGNLLPLYPYGETITRGMKFLLEDQPTWAVGNKITDEQGNTHPPYFFYCIAIHRQLDGVGWEGNRNTQYPAGHHSYFIQRLLDYYVYAGNEEALRQAEALAQWNIAHSTPLDWPCGGLPYSTAQNGRVGGSFDGDTLMLDKPSIMACAYLRLYRMAGKPEYREAAERIAATLVRTQKPAGNWPFRINPQTGKVREAYTSNVIDTIRFFEKLDAMTSKTEHAEAIARAIRWMLAGPAKDMNWNGMYEDIGEDKKNRNNWDCIETACYLVRHRAENPEYLPTALRLPTGFARRSSM